MKEHPRILVVSNNSFSKTSSNGRTLGNLFVGWPKDRLAQFCISTTVPDYELCNNYYLLTDRSVIDGFKHFRKGRRCNIESAKGTEGNTIVGGKKVVKTPLKALARHFVWRFKRWNSKEFQDWVNGFAPEIVLVMNSDATFILDIATDLSKSRDIPLAMFNTEGFYFFEKNYYRKSNWFSNSLFALYRSIYRHHFRKMMKQVVLSIHLNSLLEEDYRKEFGGEHMVLYTGSDVPFDSSNLHTENPTFSYFGNFGFNRPNALVEVAEVLQSINSSYILNVYGKVPRPEIEDQFKECNGIDYKGMIPYDEVVKTMYETTILFHAETQSEEFKESLKYGFSTKIADSISSGHPFLMYSSPNIAGAKYIIETGAGWHAQNKEELKEKVISILTDETQRSIVLEKAKVTARENHSMDGITQIFRESIYNCCQIKNKNCDLNSYTNGNRQ